jgi:hypothetical protein
LAAGKIPRLFEIGNFNRLKKFRANIFSERAGGRRKNAGAQTARVCLRAVSGLMLKNLL